MIEDNEWKIKIREGEDNEWNKNKRGEQKIDCVIPWLKWIIILALNNRCWQEGSTDSSEIVS